MPTYIAFNGPMPTTAGLARVTTGTTLKTMLQIAAPATRGLRVLEWGVSLSGFAAAAPLDLELIETGTVGATVTAHVTAGVMPYSDPGAPASLVTLGTSATGYTSNGTEGTITATRVADMQQVSPAGGWWRQWPLSREFGVAAGRTLRVRAKAAVAVDLVTYVVWEE